MSKGHVSQMDVNLELFLKPPSRSNWTKASRLRLSQMTLSGISHCRDVVVIELFRSPQLIQFKMSTHAPKEIRISRTVSSDITKRVICKLYTSCLLQSWNEWLQGWASFGYCHSSPQSMESGASSAMVGSFSRPAEGQCTALLWH